MDGGIYVGGWVFWWGGVWVDVWRVMKHRLGGGGIDRMGWVVDIGY